MPPEVEGETAVLTFSSVRLGALRRWDRLAELLASDLVVAAGLKLQPAEQERSELERLLGSNIPLSLWNPPIHGSGEGAGAIRVRPLSPAAQPRAWRSTSKKKSRRRAAAVR